MASKLMESELHHAHGAVDQDHVLNWREILTTISLVSISMTYSHRWRCRLFCTTELVCVRGSFYFG